MLSNPVRCAIYTRKSTERGLDQNVTSLEAQRDVCQSYIKCKAHRHWTEIPTAYDDGGYSGGTLERPALRRLVSDIEAGRIDVIVIYKIDRLTRSLLDFVRLMEVLQKYHVSFVSVTQAFDTSDSMGRLILNILLTFAQFERELMSDRVRDKKAAMQRKGYVTGGCPPFGYLVDSGGRLCIDDVRAPVVRELYARYLEVPSTRTLVEDLARRGCLTRKFTSKNGNVRGGQPITTAQIAHILQNPIYTGHLVHRGEWIEAQIDPLVTRERWGAVQKERQRRAPKRDPAKDFLIGLLHDEHGRRMRILRLGAGRTNSIRYYRSEASGWSRGGPHKRCLVNADDTERVLLMMICNMMRDRPALKDAVLADGRYPREVAKLLTNGAVAARRTERMAPSEIRLLVVALLPRIEVGKAELRAWVSCNELRRFLAWDGSGRFSSSSVATDQLERTHLVRSPAFLLRGHHRLSPPVEPCASTPCPNHDLLRLVQKARELSSAVLDQRQKSVLELAQERRMSQNLAVRILRMNYLAPDILTAIVDGTQPSGVTQRRLLDAAAVLDWRQQREMLGFASKD